MARPVVSEFASESTLSQGQYDQGSTATVDETRNMISVDGSRDNIVPPSLSVALRNGAGHEIEAWLEHGHVPQGADDQIAH